MSRLHSPQRGQSVWDHLTLCTVAQLLDEADEESRNSLESKQVPHYFWINDIECLLKVITKVHGRPPFKRQLSRNAKEAV